MLFHAFLLFALTASAHSHEHHDTTRCKRTTSLTYHDEYGPLFRESRYSCDLPSTLVPPPPPEKQPITAPAPYSHVSGQRGVDNMIGERGTLISERDLFSVMLLQAQQKRTIPAFGCDLFPDPQPLDEQRYSNLFWGMQQLMNQTCLDPGEVAEYIDPDTEWGADWRFTVANRGGKRECEWWQEVANVAEALHLYCFFRDLGVGERSGGIEAVSWGAADERGEGLRWCLRYGKRGWGEKVWQERCLGVRAETVGDAEDVPAREL
jgi:hypothetical protein